jgi:hypothetical protein
MTTQAERIMAVEVRVKELEDKVDAMNKKLDTLLELRYKGAGAFWLASALIGTGIIGAVAQFLNWLRAH